MGCQPTVIRLARFVIKINTLGGGITANNVNSSSAEGLWQPNRPPLNPVPIISVTLLLVQRKCQRTGILDQTHRPHKSIIKINYRVMAELMNITAIHIHMFKILLNQAHWRGIPFK